MANLGNPNLPSNLQALESSRDILKRQIQDLEKSVAFLDELRLDLEAVENAISALRGRFNPPDEARREDEIVVTGKTWASPR
jgi:prefoldin subunit 5